ncbi:3-deoxy-D-manno-octulosonic acid kinase [Vibrio splendidus ZS-139]|nr:3-deoxy-D-manno-octulosonic acid kinase [Vibrio splendidus ZS-139]
METISTKNQTIWYDPELLAQVPEGDIAQIFEAEYWQQQDAISGSAQGRGITWFIQLDGIQAALRHYRRGGLFGKLVEDQYRFSDWESTRCAMELNILKALANAGVNVPKPIAARAIKSGLLYRADLMSERIPNAKDLVDVLVNGPIDADVYRRIGQEVRKMHDAGVNHTDLNIHNILLDDSQRVWIIDFDKCGHQAGDDWKEGNLNRLKRSFLKEVNKRQIQWQEPDWELLLQGYQG